MIPCRPPRPNFWRVIFLLLTKLFLLNILIIWKGFILIGFILIVLEFAPVWLISQCYAISFAIASFTRP